jgi:hypothetical protein
MQVAQEQMDADTFNKLYQSAHAAWLEEFSQDNNAPKLVRLGQVKSSQSFPEIALTLRQQINLRLKEIARLQKTEKPVSLRQCR